LGLGSEVWSPNLDPNPISYTSRSLTLVRLHSRVMPSRLAGSRLTAAAKAHAQMHQCPPA